MAIYLPSVVPEYITIAGSLFGKFSCLNTSASDIWYYHGTTEVAKLCTLEVRYPLLNFGKYVAISRESVETIQLCFLIYKLISNLGMT